MGYSTDFDGTIALSRPLTIAEARTVLDWNEEDRGGTGKPGKHPDGYMQWLPTDDLRGLVWDGNEKFYDYVEWMEWLVARLAEWGIAGNGAIHWQGEENGDTGVLSVTGSTVIATKNKRGAASPRKPLTRRKLGDLAMEIVINAGSSGD